MTQVHAVMSGDVSGTSQDERQEKSCTVCGLALLPDMAAIMATHPACDPEVTR